VLEDSEHGAARRVTLFVDDPALFAALSPRFAPHPLENVSLEDTFIALVRSR
jgi:hypothetical protein